MVVLEREVLARAEAMQRSYGPPVLAMRLETELDRALALERARDARLRLRGGDVYWSVGEEPAGIIVRQWGSTPDVAAALAALPRALEAEGIDGRLTLHDPERPAPRALLTEREEPLLECHVRVRGERRLYTNPGDLRYAERTGTEPPAPRVRLYPDADALLAGFEAAFAWMDALPDGVTFGAAAGTRAPDVDEVRAYMAARLARAFGGHETAPRTWWESDDAFRLMVVHEDHGDVSVAVGGPRLAAGDWESPYRALLDVLRRAAGWGSYGFVKRGTRPGAVGWSLSGDWVEPAHFAGLNFGHHVYEDVLAPDAFGAQLLGPGYAGRVPSGPDWEREDLGGGSVLLVHRDPAAWFAEPFPAPELSRRAREDFGDALVSPDVFRQPTLEPFGG